MLIIRFVKIIIDIQCCLDHPIYMAILKTKRFQKIQ
jgi:hypothetical protein